MEGIDMSRRKRMLLVLMGLIPALVLGTTSWAQRGNHDDGEEMETSFDDARIFLEYNSTDDDLGVQVELDPFDAVIAWDPIDDIESIEVIVENEDVGAEMLVPLPADATSLHIPEEFLEPDTEYKVEIIAIGENGNKTIAEREFVTGS